MHDQDRFYAELPRIGAFGALTDGARFAPVPEGWFIGTADIVNSTGEVAAGRYKLVNMVGASVISALMNGTDGREFPFVFGGDGAGFAVAAQDADTARQALAAVRRWAQEEFGLDMRAALVPVTDARAAGYDLRVARFQASEGADYAMFTGGALLWVETRMKAGDYTVQMAPQGERPDLTGLSCRWSHMPAQNGVIMSLVVVPVAGADPSVLAAAYQEVIALADRLNRGGHPAPLSGAGADWPPAGATLEAHATRGTGPLWRARIKPLFESFVAWALIRTGLKIGGFDARRYARVVRDNADFRKLDDGLKMTLDCDAPTLSKIEAVLKQASDAGVLQYGITTQSEAMMTCIVPSILTDDHVHFIDGADGGYTSAAAQIKGS